MILFHGSSTVHKDSILKNGLLPRKDTKNSNWSQHHHGLVESKPELVYLTDAYPVYFAYAAVLASGGDLLIVKVEVDENDLYPDEDFMSMIFQKQYGSQLPLEIINTMMSPLDNQHIAQDCLKYNGIAATRQIPPTQILDHRIISSDNVHTIMAIGGDSFPIPVNYKFLGNHYKRAIQALFDEGELAAQAVMKEMWTITID